jgi:hypothetical protein
MGKNLLAMIAAKAYYGKDVIQVIYLPVQLAGPSLDRKR